MCMCKQELYIVTVRFYSLLLLNCLGKYHSRELAKAVSFDDFVTSSPLDEMVFKMALMQFIFEFSITD